MSLHLRAESATSCLSPMNRSRVDGNGELRVHLSTLRLVGSFIV
jgi:hypothetical protein